jgi:anthranilate phosphoribosyltransferase
MLSEYFSTAVPIERGDVFLMRGTEGETVANAKRSQQIEWFHAHEKTTLVERQAPVSDMPPLPASTDAQTTAAWIEEALQGRQPVPQPIAEQVSQCLMVSKGIRARADSSR